MAVNDVLGSRVGEDCLAIYNEWVDSEARKEMWDKVGREGWFGFLTKGIIEKNTAVVHRKGWIWKFTTSTRVLRPSNWKKRWFVMHENNLAYYSSAKSKECKKKIPWSSVVSVTANADTSFHECASDSRSAYFGIVFMKKRNSHEKKLVLRAASTSERNGWIRSLAQCLPNAIIERKALPNNSFQDEGSPKVPEMNKKEPTRFSAGERDSQSESDSDDDDQEAAVVVKPKYFENLLETVALNEAALPQCPQIDRDIPRTLTQHQMESEVMPHVRSVLLAYSVRNTVIGYCQGMNFITANFKCTGLDDEKCFWVLAYIVETLLPDYYESLTGVRIDCQILEGMLEVIDRDFAAELEGSGNTVSLLCTSLLLCIFCTAFPPEASLAIFSEIMGTQASAPGNPESGLCPGRCLMLRIACYAVLQCKQELTGCTAGEGIAVVKRWCARQYDGVKVVHNAVEATAALTLEEVQKRHDAATSTIAAQSADEGRHKEVVELCRTTKLQKVDLIRMQHEFQLAVIMHLDIPSIDLVEFTRILSNIHLEAYVYNPVVLFRLWAGKDERLSFKALMHGLSSISQDPIEERLRICFLSHDCNGDGKIDRTELWTMLQHQFWTALLCLESEERKAKNNHIDLLYEHFDFDNDDALSLAEFVSAVRGSPPIILYFEDGLPKLPSRPLWKAEDNRPQRVERAERCRICENEFSPLRPMRHCKHCGQVVCASCAHKKINLPGLGYAKPVRVCDVCRAKLGKEEALIGPLDSPEDAKKKKGFLKKIFGK